MREKLKELLDAMRTARFAEEKLYSHLARRLEGVPQAPEDVRELVLELARCQQASDVYVKNPDYDRSHEHLACRSATTPACPRCVEWNSICVRKDAAVAALTRYGLALLDGETQEQAA